MKEAEATNQPSFCFFAPFFRGLKALALFDFNPVKQVQPFTLHRCKLVFQRHELDVARQQ